MSYKGKIYKLKKDPTYYILVVRDTGTLVTVFPISFDFIKATPDDVLINVRLDYIKQPIISIIMLNLIAEFDKKYIDFYFEKDGELVSNILPYVDLFIDGKIDINKIPDRGAGYGIPSKKKFKEEQMDLYIKYLLSIYIKEVEEIEEKI